LKGSAVDSGCLRFLGLAIAATVLITIGLILALL
jgi:hypothetical protein